MKAPLWITVLLAWLLMLAVLELVELHIVYVQPANDKLKECVANNENHRPCQLYFVAWPIKPTLEKQL